VFRIPETHGPVINDFLISYQRKKLAENLHTLTDLMLPDKPALPISVPFYSSKVPIDFPSPADEYVKNRLDPSESLIDQKDANFFVAIKANYMIDTVLLPGNKAVVGK